MDGQEDNILWEDKAGNVGSEDITLSGHCGKENGNLDNTRADKNNKI